MGHHTNNILRTPDGLAREPEKIPRTPSHGILEIQQEIQGNRTAYLPGPATEPRTAATAGDTPEEPETTPRPGPTDAASGSRSPRAGSPQCRRNETGRTNTTEASITHLTLPCIPRRPTQGSHPDTDRTETIQATRWTIRNSSTPTRAMDIGATAIDTHSIATTPTRRATAPPPRKHTTRKNNVGHPSVTTERRACNGDPRYATVPRRCEHRDIQDSPHGHPW